MTTLYVSHHAALAHEPPLGHPERPDRLRAIEKVLADQRFAALRRIEAPAAERADIERAHPARHVEAVFAASPEAGTVHLDADTAMSAGTFEAALRTVGGALRAVDEVAGGLARNAFVAMRPPGHHAESVRAMGFCFFNNAAIAARHAQARHGMARVAIFDWDVHHGNGTQEIFWADKTVLYASTHEMPLYPGTGAASERGEHGTILNAPLRAGDDGTVFREAMEAKILPGIETFAPELIIISAGFDAHWRDPLANLNLTEADFGWATRKLADIADRHAGGRVVSLLEGGYDLQGLGSSVAAHVEALMKG
jgi:acetoin utilization deacetylase AcuC-like enzyme